MQKKLLFECKIPGKPIAKTRPRFTKTGHAYDSQDKIKKQIKMFFKSKIQDEGYLKADGSILSAKMIFGIPIPKSISRKQKNSLLDNFCPKRPDLDNYIKFYLDAMNEIVYNDDSQIVQFSDCEKRYTEEPYTLIELYELHGT